MHGGGATGRPIKDGRYSRYRRIFGDRYLSLLTDPDLLKCDSEIALFDTYLTERAETLEYGLSIAWIHQLVDADHELCECLGSYNIPPRVAESAQKLHQLIQDGGDRQAAWLDVLDASQKRAEIALKAETVLARREQTMTEGQMVVLFVRMLEIIADVVGADVARCIGARIEVEILGNPKRLAAGDERSDPVAPDGQPVQDVLSAVPV